MDKINNDDIKTVLGIDELKDYKTLIRQLSAEFVGTFLYLSIVLYANIGLIGSSNITTAFANGLLVASIIQIIGPISGGHINPAITIGALVCGHTKVLKAILYVSVQVLGSIIGSFIAYALSDDSSRSSGNLGATVPFSSLREDQILGLEFLMTFVLVAVFLSVSDRKRGDRGLGSGPLAIGLTVTACQCSALTYTGSLNPVRSLGPAVVMDIWDYHWVFWVGPLLGGLVAGIFYKIFTCNFNADHSVEE